MAKSIKLKNNTYIDSSGVAYERNPLTTIINNLRNLELFTIKVLSTFNPDNITTGGLYQIACSLQTFENVPSDVNYGVMVVLSASGGNGGAWQNTQIILDNSGRIIYRCRVNSHWGAWYRVTYT